MTRATLNTLNCIVGEVRAWKDVWIIRDAFINETFDTLFSMKNQAKEEKRAKPYIFDYYNVKCFAVDPLSASSDVIANLINCMIRAINENAKLPRHIIVIPENNLVKHFNNYGYGINLISGGCLSYITCQMECVIEGQKDELRCKRPGAVAPSEPKIIWVKMFNRTANPSKELAVRVKFNTALKNILANKRNHYIIDVTNAMYKSDYFSQNNRITARGKSRFWMEIDQVIEDFNSQKRSLRPVSMDIGKTGDKPSWTTSAVSSGKQLRQVGVAKPTQIYKMPPPPPESTSKMAKTGQHKTYGHRY